MNRSDLQKLIDSCRSEADLQLAELQPLAELLATDPAVQARFEKSLQMDAEIRQVIRDVPVPTGLESRLLAGLGQSVLDQDPPENVLSERRLTSGTEQATVKKRRWNWIALAAGASGVAALVLISLTFWPASRPQVATEEQARAQAVEWIAQLQSSGWKTGTPPQELALPGELRVRPGRWQPVRSGFRSPDAVCYDLTSPGSGAFIFVANARQATSLPSIPPATTYPKGSWHIAAWKSQMKGGDIVYLLAVEHGSRQYQNLIRRPSNLASRQGRKSSLSGKV